MERRVRGEVVCADFTPILDILPPSILQEASMRASVRRTPYGYTYIEEKRFFHLHEERKYYSFADLFVVTVEITPLGNRATVCKTTANPKKYQSVRELVGDFLADFIVPAIFERFRDDPIRLVGCLNRLLKVFKERYGSFAKLSRTISRYLHKALKEEKSLRRILIFRKFVGVFGIEPAFVHPEGEVADITLFVSDALESKIKPEVKRIIQEVSEKRAISSVKLVLMTEDRSQILPRSYKWECLFPLFLYARKVKGGYVAIVMFRAA